MNKEIPQFESDTTFIKVNSRSPECCCESVIKRAADADLAGKELSDSISGIVIAVGLQLGLSSVEEKLLQQMETLARDAFDDNIDEYPFVYYSSTNHYQVDCTPMWKEFVVDLNTGVNAKKISAKLHMGLIRLLCRIVQCHASGAIITRVVVCGSIMRNSILKDNVTALLQMEGLSVMLCEQSVRNKRVIRDREPSSRETIIFVRQELVGQLDVLL